MRFTRSHRVLFAALAASLAACSGQQSVMPSQAQATLLAPNAVTAPAFGSNFAIDALKSTPCAPKGFWDMHGPCKVLAISAKGTTFPLAAYKGLTTKFDLAQNNAKGTAVKFAIGEATGAGDITGTVGGHAFPTYGSKGTGCYAPSGSSFKPVKCVGKGLLYFIALNVSKSTVTFAGTPAITVSGVKATKCQPDILGSTGSSYAWILLPMHAAPKAGTIKFGSFATSLKSDPHSAYILGISCT